jgi:hypothetical protein
MYQIVSCKGRAHSKVAIYYSEWALSFLRIFSTVQSPPRIVRQPPTDELLFQVATRQAEGDLGDKPFIIECKAEGEPAPK